MQNVTVSINKKSDKFIKKINSDPKISPNNTGNSSLKKQINNVNGVQTPDTTPNQNKPAKNKDDEGLVITKRSLGSPLSKKNISEFQEKHDGGHSSKMEQLSVTKKDCEQHQETSQENCSMDKDDDNVCRLSKDIDVKDQNPTSILKNSNRTIIFLDTTSHPQSMRKVNRKNPQSNSKNSNKDSEKGSQRKRRVRFKKENEVFIVKSYKAYNQGVFHDDANSHSLSCFQSCRLL